MKLFVKLSLVAFATLLVVLTGCDIMSTRVYHDYDFTLDAISGHVDIVTEATEDEPLSSVTSRASGVESISIDELNIGSADVFGFSYNFEYQHWNTPAYAEQSTDTYLNDDYALLLVDALKFNRNVSHEFYLNNDNVQRNMDILYFDNNWHSVLFDGEWYGDHGRETEGVVHDNYVNVYEDEEGNFVQFSAFDVVFVSQEILDHTVLFDMNNQSGLTPEELDVVLKIHNQVRAIEDKALFIPMDSIRNLNSGKIHVRLWMRDMIQEIDATNRRVVWNLNEYGSPVHYDVISMKM